MFGINKTTISIFIILIKTPAFGATRTLLLNTIPNTNPNNLAIAGASVSLKKEYSVNPAAAAFANSNLNFSFMPSTKTEDFSQSEEYYSAKNFSGTTSIKTSAGTIGNKFSAQETELYKFYDINSATKLIYEQQNIETKNSTSIRIFDELAIAFGLVGNFGKQSVSINKPLQNIEAQEYLNLGLELGFLLSYEHLQLGFMTNSSLASWQKSSIIPFLGQKLFDPYSPSLAAIGASYDFTDFSCGISSCRLTLMSQLDFHQFNKTGNDALVKRGSMVFESTYALYATNDDVQSKNTMDKVETSTLTIPRTGVSLEFFKKDSLALDVKIGGYIEPALNSDMKNNSHYTYGLGAKFHGFSLTAAYDYGEKNKFLLVGLNANSSLN